MGDSSDDHEKQLIILSVFTHPACNGCGAAVEMGWELTQELSGVQLKTVKLENREGLKKAQDFKIKTIPTLVILKGEEECERLVGLPKKEKLEETLKRHLN